jgi:hypothetical protein
MAFAPLDSAEIVNSAAVPPVLNAGLTEGELRIKTNILTVTSAGKDCVANLMKLPAGHIRVFPRLSHIRIEDAVAAANGSIGFAAYTAANGAVVSADVDALLTSGDIGNSTSGLVLLGTQEDGELYVDLNSKDGVTVTLTVTADQNINAGTIMTAIAYVPVA